MGTSFIHHCVGGDQTLAVGVCVTVDEMRPDVTVLSLRNRAIADYLRSNGYEEAYSTFKKEAELDMVRHTHTKILKPMTT